MMRAIVTKPFWGVKDGAVMPQEFVKGDAIFGDLAEAAVRFKDAKETDDSKQASDAAAAAAASLAAAEELAADLVKRKLEAREQFDSATDEQLAEGAAFLKVDLADTTDRDVIFERMWLATIATPAAAAKSTKA